MIKELRSANASIVVYEDAFNKRIRIDDYYGERHELLALIREATPSWAEKLIVKSRANDIDWFGESGFTREAFIAGYFNGVDLHFATKYLSPARSIASRKNIEDKIIDDIHRGATTLHHFEPEAVTLATPDDAGQLAALYHSIFEVYPTPLHNADHIRNTMEAGTMYVMIRDGSKILSTASAEINRTYHNAELTDCATTPEAQGKGHMRCLLMHLEDLLVPQGITSLYSIARAESFGMNKVFHQLNYTYGGRLVNNCLIYSGLEDMNVWYKLV